MAVTVRLDADMKARIDAAREAGHVVNVSAILKAALEAELARIDQVGKPSRRRGGDHGE